MVATRYAKPFVQRVTIPEDAPKGFVRVVGQAGQEGVIRFFRAGKADYKDGSLPLKWAVSGEDTVELTSTRWAHPLVLTFREDRSGYDATMKGDRLKRRGRLLEQK